MSCSPFELKDYFLKELPDHEGRQVEAHVKSCQSCHEELDRLRLTESALFALRDEEIPQRIAFVSDKIFEPSPARRWWNAFWGSTGKLGFAAAAVMAIVMVARPARTVVVQQVQPQAAGAQVQAVSDADIQARVDAAIAKQATEVRALKADLDDTRKWLQVSMAQYEQAQKRMEVMRAAYLRAAASPDGEQQ